jgi:hypothetical protein
MTIIVDARVEVGAPVFEGRARRTAAVLLVLGPALMLAAAGMSMVASSQAPGAEDAAVAVAAPTPYFLGLALDLLSVPAMLAFTVVLLLGVRPWARRTAWTGAVALGLQGCGLAAVTGMELCAATLAVSGLDPTRIADVMNAHITDSPAGITLAILFFPTEIVGLIALGIATWRTRWAPRSVAVLLIASPFIDFFVNGTPWASAGFFTVFLAAGAWLAVRVLRDGAPRPVPAGHTA